MTVGAKNWQTMKQTISDIIDRRPEAVDAGEPFERIATDADSCRAWRDYHLIGDVIRGEVTATGTCLIARVQDALADEPTVLAPGAKRSATAESDRSASTGGSRGDTLKAAGLFAVAASLALVAVITRAPDSSAPVAGPELAAVPTPSAEAVQAPQVAGATGSDTQQAFASEFGQMLAEHGEFTSSAALNGLLSYAKLVSNEPLAE